MKVNYVILCLILIGSCVSGCAALVFDIHQNKHSGGKINIYIHTHSNKNPKVNIFIDNVRVDMNTLRSLVEQKTKPGYQKPAYQKPAYQIYGTF